MAKQSSVFTSVDKGMAILRMVTGLLMAYHGLEVFKPDTMHTYLEWESIKALPFSKYMLYLGKGTELFAGILLAAGLLTRFAAVCCAIVMLFICFFIGNGRFWYEDQHPFLFAMLCIVFLVFGSGAFALDKVIKRK
jgi:putative oxidoreductase